MIIDITDSVSYRYHAAEFDLRIYNLPLNIYLHKTNSYNTLYL